MMPRSWWTSSRQKMELLPTLRSPYRKPRPRSSNLKKRCSISDDNKQTRTQKMSPPESRIVSVPTAWRPSTSSTRRYWQYYKRTPVAWPTRSTFPGVPEVHSVTLWQLRSLRSSMEGSMIEYCQTGEAVQ